MKVIIAPNSMKGTINAFDFANIVEKAMFDCSANFKIKKIPVADGGDYTAEVLIKKQKAKIIKTEVCGPLGKKVPSKFAVFGKTAIIEMADASGMKLLTHSELNPLQASSYGTGQLINEAVNWGCTEILLAIGGSATVDGGMGMLESLGFLFQDKKGVELKGNGENLSKLNQINAPKNLPSISIKIICDVDNPALGKSGAAAVFGPQKGASPKMVVQLEKGLKNYLNILEKETGVKLQNLKGGGAAGGISLPLVSFFNAEIVPGAEFVLEQLDFRNEVKWADVIITGEGKIDAQTLHNKAPFAVAYTAKKYNKYVVGIGGSVELQPGKEFDELISLVSGNISIDYAINNTKEVIYNVSYKLARQLLAMDLRK